MNQNTKYNATTQMELLPQALIDPAEPTSHPDHSDNENGIPSGRPTTGKALPGSKGAPVESPARILIVADHAVVRLGIRQLVSSDSAFTVCGEADMPRQALDAIAALSPTAAIIDATMPGRISLIEDIQREHGPLPILAFSLRHNPTCAERLIRAGALGYIVENEFAEKLVEALHLVVAGKAYYSPELSQQLWNRLHGNQPDSPTDVLSPRQFEVLRQVGTGRGTRQIAEEMDLSVKTIETHRSHIMEKLNLQSAPELVRFAAQWNLESGEGGPSL